MPSPTDERIADALEELVRLLADIEVELKHIEAHYCTVTDKYYGCRDRLQERGEEE